jgi:lysyl-tRNA synthetase class I
VKIVLEMASPHVQGTIIDMEVERLKKLKEQAEKWVRDYERRRADCKPGESKMQEMFDAIKQLSETQLKNIEDALSKLRSLQEAFQSGLWK